ncbi:hypothetical protein GCM10027275_06500 [Rhabdobacter roseus]|uniref:CBS domain-containing protein n=1 Tax=Rhabdobacter roseus TaxID=1655419 RepID=A0A840TEJ4_9BACT|nr:CBS domain-containing protein [Rhabdobacter roseus]MBB5282546.1 CBS domain-containing protein [Rhabdobacter roseus]
MKRREPITHIMTENVLAVNLADDLHEVVDLFNKHKIRHVPVLNGQEVVGMISRTDINRLTFSALFDNQAGVDEAVLTMLTLEQVMTHKPRLIRADQTIRDVAEIFTQEEFHALPVTDEKGTLVGIVTTTDVMRYLLDLY